MIAGVSDLSEISHLQRRIVTKIFKYHIFNDEDTLAIFLLKLDAPLRLNNFVSKANFFENQGGGPESVFPKSSALKYALFKRVMLIRS